MNKENQMVPLEETEYKILGNNINNISIKYGMFLILWGGFVSFASNSTSITSWIPAFFGIPIFFLGWGSRLNLEKKKFFVHMAMVLGLLICIGGLDFIRELFFSDKIFQNFWASISKLMMLVSGILYCFFCVFAFLFFDVLFSFVFCFLFFF